MTAEYYDRILVAIPAAIVLVALGSLAAGVPLYQGIAAGSVLATIVMLDAIFRNPPIEPGATRAAAVGTVGAGWILALGLWL